MHQNRIVQVVCSALVCAMLIIPIGVLADQIILLPGTDKPVSVGTDLNGTLIGPDGNTPLAGETVTLKQGDKIVKQVKTSETGTYSLGKVEPGKYTLEVQGQATDLTVSASQASEALVTTLPKTVRLPSQTIEVANAEITGQVFHVDGKTPLSNVEMSVLSNLGATVAKITTTGSGDYLISNLVPGLYSLQIGTGLVQFEVVDGLVPRRINLIIPEGIWPPTPDKVGLWGGLTTWEKIAYPTGAVVIITGITIGTNSILDDNDGDPPPGRSTPAPKPPMSPVVP